MNNRTINLDNAKLIGHIGVDSGQMMLCDPCYIDSWDHEDRDFDFDADKCDEPKNTNFSYAGACEATLSKNRAGLLGRGMAAVSSTGFGDGTYPVYVEFSDEGSWGQRVKSMTILFIEDEQDDDEQDEFCESCGVELNGFEFDLCTRCEEERDDEMMEEDDE